LVGARRRCVSPLSRWTALRRAHRSRRRGLRLGHGYVMTHRPIRSAFYERTDFRPASFFAVLHHDDHVPGTVVRHVEPQRRWLLRTGHESCTNDAQEQNRREMDLHIESPSKALKPPQKFLTAKFAKDSQSAQRKTRVVPFNMLRP